MAHLTWLADVLRAANLKVIEVDGWKTRGSDTFAPVGVTWHATAGSRTATALGEVSVILHGSATAPPPIAQLMIWRDGTVYVCAAGRCNHNKVGWAGPNKGLGNTQLLGIECANDNKGEPWPVVQLDALRTATAVIMRKLDADPMRRLAAHYEHQPAAGRPAGETSIKSDPFGIRMTDERPLVAGIMKGEDMLTEEQIADIAAAVWGTQVGRDERRRTALELLLESRSAAQTAAAALPALAARDDVDEEVLGAAVGAALAPAVIAYLDNLPEGELTVDGVKAAVRDVLRTGVGG